MLNRLFKIRHNLGDLILPSVFLGSLMLLDCLILLSVERFHIRAIYSTLFLVLIPGSLLILLLKIKIESFWSWILLSSGLSLSYLMMGGLIFNTMSLLFNLPRPIAAVPLLYFINITHLPLIFILLHKNFRVKCNIKHSISILFIFKSLLPYCLLLLTISGSILFINNIQNYNTLIGLFVISLLIFILIIKGNMVSKNFLITSLSAFSLYTLLMISLRGRTYFGSDILGEQFVLELTKYHGFWKDGNLPGSLYNLCLSITVLPAIISVIANVNNLVVFKVIFPIIFSLIPIGIFLTANKYSNNVVSFVTSVFFLASPSFWNIMPTHEREGISFFFFVLFTYLLFTKNFNRIIRFALLLIVGLAVIFSHYSTAFIMIIWLTIIYFISLTSKIIVKTKNFVLKNRLSFVNKFRFDSKVSIVLIVLFWFTFLAWYTRAPNNNFVGFLQVTFDNLKHTFDSENNRNLKADRSSIVDQLNINYKSDPESILLKEFKTLQYSAIKGYDLYPKDTYKDYKIQYKPSSSDKALINTPLSYNLFSFGEIIKRLGLLFILIGLLSVIFIRKNRNKIVKAYLVSSIVFSIFVILSIIIPFISKGYDIGRVYIQSLVVLSLIATFGLFSILLKLKRLGLFIIAFFISMHFLLFTGALYFTFGTTYSPIQFSNKSQDYDILYVHGEELLSSKWFSKNAKGALVYADTFTRNVLKIDNNSLNVLYYKLLIPSLIPQQAYVFSGVTNTVNNRAYAWLNNVTIGYGYPINFLNNYKNTIYNNGGSKIYK